MNRLATALACLGLLLCAAQAAFAQQSQPSDPQKDDVAQLRKELQDLKAMLQEQRRAHDAEMKELRQQFASLATTQQAVAASRPVKGPTTAADDLAAAIQEAQAEATPPEKGKPAAAGGNWFGLVNQSAPIQSFNPDISLVGDFQGRHDSDKGGVFSDKRFVKELELNIAGNVDPYVRFDSVFSVHPKEYEETGYDISVEEAYISPLTKPYGLDGKLGKFRTDFGKVNELHQHALPWPEYPLVIQKFFGEEGMAGEGVSISWLAPGNHYVELTSQSITKSKDSLLAGDDSDSFVQLGHLKTFTDLSKESTLELGFSGAVMPNSNTPGTSHDAVEGMDLTFKWRPQKEGLYKSVKWINEFMVSQRDLGGQAVNAFGLYTAPEYQFDRRWAAGLRYDFVQDPDDNSRKTNAVGAYLTFMQSEFCYWRVGYQVSHTNFLVNDSDIDHTVFLQLDFTLGPHPAHKY